jgi:hypothetical protein
MRNYLLTTLMTGLLLAPAALFAAPRQGMPIVLPEGATRTERTYPLVDEAPTVRIVRPGVLELNFITSEPVPPPVVYIGINKLNEELDYARYRDLHREKGSITDLATTHSIEVDIHSMVAKSPNTPFEPRIVWRVEVYLPKLQSSRFMDGRVYFDPATLGDTVNVLSGPTVDVVTADSAFISFETDRATTSSVQADGRTFSGDGETTDHVIQLTGLKPASAVEYRVTAGGTLVRPYSFTTSGGDKPIHFAAMVDSREGLGGGEIQFGGVEYRALYALGSDLYYRGADFVVFGGDLINGYTTSARDFRRQINAFRTAMGPVAARIPIYESMGNHEALLDSFNVPGTTRSLNIDKLGDTNAESLFAEMFVNPTNGPADEGPGTPTYSENVYSFDHGSVRVFMLNNNYWYSADPHKVGGNLEGYIMANQMKWLRDGVAAADADPAIKHLFFVAQEPPFPNGGHTSDCMWYKGGDTNRDGRVDAADIDIVGNRNTMWEIIAASPKSVAFITGDEHAYSRLEVTDETPVGPKHKLDGTPAKFAHRIWQVTSGGAGAPWYDKELHLPWSGSLKAHSTQPHYAYFTIDGNRVSVAAYSQTGQRIDAAELK